MPGIFGTMLCEDGRSRLPLMRDALRTTPYLVDAPDTRVGLVEGSQLSLDVLGTHGAQSASNDLTIWIDGEVYNLAEVARKQNQPQASLTDLLLHAYGRGALDEVLAQLDGYFCGALYDQVRQVVTLFTDRFGMRLLYAHSRAGAVAWASELKALLALDTVSREPEPLAVHAMLNVGYLLEDRTWYRDIRLVEPATILEISIPDAAQVSRRYWRWRDLPRPDLSFDRAVDRTHELFAAAIRRRIKPDERIGITLSGGLDSRALLAAMATDLSQPPGRAITYGHPRCDDVRYAARAAATAGWPHESFDFPDDWLAARLGSVWRTDGTVSLMHQHGAEFFHDVHDRVDVVLNGYAGDVVAGGGWLTSAQNGGRITRERLRDFYGTALDTLSVDPDFYGTENLEPHLLMNRVRRYTLMGTVNTLPFYAQRKPFFDNELLALLMTMPAEYRQGGRLYHAMLLRHYPAFYRSIPWQKTGLPIGAPAWAASLNKRRRNATHRIANLLHVPRRRPSSFVNYRERLRDPVIRRWIAALLTGKRSRLGDVVDPKPLLTLLSQLDGIRDVSEPIFRYITLEIWLRALEDGGPWRGLERGPRPLALPDPNAA